MNLSLNWFKDQMRKKKWGLGRWGKRGEGDRVGGGGGWSRGKLPRWWFGREKGGLNAQKWAGRGRAR